MDLGQAGDACTARSHAGSHQKIAPTTLRLPWQTILTNDELCDLVEAVATERERDAP